MDVPVIETERLLLRGWDEADVAAMAEIQADPEVMRFIGGAPRDIGLVWDGYLRNLGAWARYGYGQWAVVEKADGALLGQLGFMRRRRGLGEDFDAAPECGWVLARAAWGRGIGFEAGRAAHGWFDARSRNARSHVIMDAEHVASYRLARKLGYRDWRAGTFQGDAVRLMARDGRDGAAGGGAGA